MKDKSIVNGPLGQVFWLKEFSKFSFYLSSNHTIYRTLPFPKNE